MELINFKTIEEKWQKRWEKEKAFQVKESSKKKKFYVLEMFPYPSASGLHMGHAFNYTLGDIYARFKRMKGFNVLYPMGYDALGLPAENAAIHAGKHPKKYTEKSITNFIKQQKSLGLSYDWSRLVKTCDPEYYKWNQYFFLKFLEKGLAYRKKAPVNWCPKCNTVLANEQVHNGICWRHPDTEVGIKQLEQWFIKTTNYADELLKKVEKLDWPEKIKTMQKNWIGRSEGVDIYFKLEGTSWTLPTYTTRCDTIYSVTFLAIAPEHPMIDELIKDIKNKNEIKNFAQKLARDSVADRINEEKEKEGIFTGRYAINPVNKEKIPIYIANFALMYGSGIVMCDAHDKRDFRFARKYNIPLKFVISKDGKKIDPKNHEDAFVEDGILFDSGKFNSMKNTEALPKIAKWLEKEKYGKRTINYKLKDWLISRQRYWGTPIPIIYCNKCGVVQVPERDLPIKLPEKVSFGKGNPLATNKEFLNVKCPKCKGKARRETDTMDTFFDSSWYFLRYCDPKNNKKPFDTNKAKYWMPVDQYIGGAEHACMHLIYARFFAKALRDLSIIKLDEPFTKLFNQGMLHGENGAVMSKSKGNVVLPETVSEKYGIDSARLFLVSLGGADKDRDWSEKGVEGSLRFIQKIIEFSKKAKFTKSSPKVEHKINKAILEVSEDIENLRYNLAIIKLRALFDFFQNNELSKKDFESFLKILAPFCPHITEELFSKLGNKKLISLADWPKADKRKINKKFEEEEKLIEKAVSDIMNILNIIKKGKTVYLYVLPQEKDSYNEKTLSARTQRQVKVFAVNDKNKYDPQNKSKKARPEKPAIYIE